MSYQAIARKYRPETFGQVVGQAHVTATLRAALRKGKLHHAYLFSGPRGCGKTTVARLLAKALNCAAPVDGDPCGRCDTCRAIARGSDLDVLEIDAASNTGVDNVRELRDMAQYSTAGGSNRVFIIDEVHMLSKGAFNALLKILEEPPARVYFFFATTEANKIPRTILSRCQRFDFRLLGRDELAGRLKEVAAAEGVVVDEAGLRLLVSLAEGSLRDGLSLLDQVIAGAGETIDEKAVADAFGLVASELFLQLNECMLAKDAARALRLVEDLAAAGQSLDGFARGVVTNFRNLLLLRVDPQLAPMVDLPPDRVEALRRHAEGFSEQDLLALIDIASRHFERIHRSTQPRILLEAAVVEYCRFESRVLLADLARRLTDAGVAPAAGGAAGGGAGAGPSAGPGAGSGARPGVADRAAGYAGAGSAPTRAAAAAGRATYTGAPGGAARDAGAATKSPDLTSADQAVPGWTRYIDALMKRHPRLGSCLMTGLPELDEAAGCLRVVFAADKKFVVDSIAGETGKLAELAAAQWGRPLKVFLEHGPRGQQVEVAEEIRQEVAPTHREELQKACAVDPALGDLVDLLGGQPLPESERGRWDPPAR
ncbi:DNA polymerase III subunit gamma/tau [bacterium]|nr:DNA polymerase III subunit gamma/tau [bacterium]